jgi:hypothetical protein
MELYFSGYYGIKPAVLEQYGAFDISMVSDLPLFIDPFLLFGSRKPEYQALHEEILKYLRFLREHATEDLDPALIDDWYRFKEVKQNWLGYTLFGNAGSGLGADFAASLHGALGTIFTDFGEEKITRSSHLEKLCLIRPGVGKDNISDFTTVLIKAYLLRYTEAFTKKHIKRANRATFNVQRAVFDYETEAWLPKTYCLPRRGDDFVILTPADLLTREDTWISQGDLRRKFATLAEAVPDQQLRARINRYFHKRLGDDPDAAQRAKAIAETIARYPLLIDYYIRGQEDRRDEARSVSAERVDQARAVLVAQVRAAIAALESHGGFYDKPNGTYAESLARAKWFKDYVENQDGYKVINRPGQPFSRETEVQLFFGLIWYRTDFDVNREVNNGRGPVDYKVSDGAIDKSLIEFKLGSNKALKRNLENQLPIYQAANRTKFAVKVIVSYTAHDQTRVESILKQLRLENEESIVLIDARRDNKPSASTA